MGTQYTWYSRNGAGEQTLLSNPSWFSYISSRSLASLAFGLVLCSSKLLATHITIPSTMRSAFHGIPATNQHYTSPSHTQHTCTAPHSDSHTTSTCANQPDSATAWGEMTSPPDHHRCHPRFGAENRATTLQVGLRPCRVARRVRGRRSCCRSAR